MARNMYVDVRKLLHDGLQLPVPDVLPFSDDFCLFYSGSFNLIYGDTESGKTWLCLAAVASVLNDGGTATIVDLDHNGARALIGNLIKLGVDLEILEDGSRFRLSEPEDRLDLKEVVQDQLVVKPDVVILDSLGEILPLFRANSNSADDFTTVHAEVIKPLTRNGASVLVVDHLAKNADSRSFGPTGTAAKMRAADGVAIRVTAEQQFTPGSGGTAKLQVYKDRYGGVRNNYPSDPKPVIGTFELISDGDTLDYAFHSAQVIPIRKARKDDREQLAEDVAKLREFHTTKPTVRQARQTLRCRQDRAVEAVNAFTNVEDEAAADTGLEVAAPGSGLTRAFPSPCAAPLPATSQWLQHQPVITKLHGATEIWRREAAGEAFRIRALARLGASPRQRGTEKDRRNHGMQAHWLQQTSAFAWLVHNPLLPPLAFRPAHGRAGSVPHAER